jgi:hypothetical protein
MSFVSSQSLVNEGYVIRWRVCPSKSRSGKAGLASRRVVGFRLVTRVYQFESHEVRINFN